MTDDTAGAPLQQVAGRQAISPRDGGALVYVAAHSQLAHGTDCSGGAVPMVALSELVDDDVQVWVLLTPDAAIGLAAQLLAVAQGVRGQR